MSRHRWDLHGSKSLAWDLMLIANVTMKVDKELGMCP